MASLIESKTALSKFIAKRKTEFKLKKAASLAGSLDPFQFNVTNKGDLQLVGDNTQIYVKVFPHPRSPELPDVIGAASLLSLSTLVNKATSLFDKTDISDKLTGSTLSCQISRSINEVGEWSIGVKHTENWHNHIRSGDWVVIYLGNDIYGDKNKSIRLIGQIDRISKKRVVTALGSWTNMWTISGRDFGKIFEDTNVFLSTQLATRVDYEHLEKLLNPSDQIKDPSSYIKVYFDTIMGNNFKVVTRAKVPASLVSFLGQAGDNLLSIMDLDINATLGHCVAKSIPENTFMSLLDMVQSASNAPWNEYIFDIIDGTPTFTFQPAALKFDDLSDLAQSTATLLPRKYVVDTDLGLSDHERFNFIEMHTTPGGTAESIESWVLAARGIPVVPGSVEKYGLKKYEVTTEFAHPTLTSKAEKLSGMNTLIFNDLRDVLADYMFKKHRFLNGSISLLTDNFIPNIGKWIITEDDILLKVEGTSLSWEHGSAMNVALTVTHGMVLGPNGQPTFADEGTKSDDDLDPIFITKDIKSPASGATLQGSVDAIVNLISGLV